VSAIAAGAVTDGTFEAPINFPLDDIGKKLKGGEAPIWTSVPEQETEGTTSNGRDKPRVDLPLVSYVPQIQPQGRFNVLQQYEGVVLSADGETFWARLNNKTSPDADEEEGEFPLEEVSKDDRWLVKPGYIFYWYIGYYDSASGQRTRQSVIRFRRLPAFTSEDLKHAREKAKKLMEAFRLAEEDDELGGE
jgi:hypothetical protein